MMIKKVFSLMTSIVVVVILVWLTYAWLKDEHPDKLAKSRTGIHHRQVAVKVITQTIHIKALTRQFVAVGTSRARLSVNIFPAVTEEVTAVLFNPSQFVERDQLLIQLDDREEILALKLAQIRLKDARSLLSRYEQAVKEGGVPESQVDTTRADYEAAEIALNQAKLSLAHRKIKAPFAGVVGMPNVDPGDRVTQQTLITGLDDRKVIYVDFEVPEALAEHLINATKMGQEVIAITPAYPTQVFTGTIAAQESRVNEDRRTLLARATFDNQRDEIRPGMSFDIRWLIPGKSHATVPEISLQWGRAGAHIWLIRDSQAQKIPVKVIARQEGIVFVDGDISEGEKVVVEGLQRLAPEVHVEVLGTNGT